MELISGRLKRIIIGCTIAGGLLGFILGTLAPLAVSESAVGIRVAVNSAVYFCILGAFIGFCLPLCIGVTNRIVYKYNMLVKIITNIIAIIITIGLIYLFFIAWNYLGAKLLTYYARGG